MAIRSKAPSKDQEAASSPLGATTGAMLRDLVAPPDDDDASSDWRLPTEFDGLHVVCPLGRGGMGQVFLAEERALARQVAVKILSRAPVSDTESERLLREARLLASLRHPGIVVVYRVGSVEGRPYLVYELVRGRSLAHATMPMPSARALSIARDAASALTAVHAAGLVHGDVKPANLVLGDDGAVKLIDFGLAGHEAEGGERAAGTPGYMAKEARVSGRVTQRSDVYSLAVVIAELLTGRRDRRALSEVEHARVRGSRWLPPPALIEAVERALSDSEEARPTSLELHSLLAQLANEATQRSDTNSPSEEADSFTSTSETDRHARRATRPERAPRGRTTMEQQQVATTRPKWEIRRQPNNIYVITFHEVMTDPEYREHLRAFTALFDAPGPLALVFDGTNARGQLASQRRMMAEWIKANKATLQSKCVALALITPNPLVRGLVTAIFWVSPPPVEHAFFSSLHEGVSWAEAKVRGR